MSLNNENRKVIEIVKSGDWKHAGSAEAAEIAELEKAMKSDEVTGDEKLTFLKAMLNTENPAKFYGLAIVAKQCVTFAEYDDVEEKKKALSDWNYLLIQFAMELGDATEEDIDEAIEAYVETEIGSARVGNSLRQIMMGAPQTFE